VANNPRRVTIAVPTYRRADLLARLLDELARQTRLPDRLVVVDGEGGAPAVREALVRSGWPERAETILVPSTHANLPFQRWLARRLAGDSDALLFFDDDLLLPERDTVAKLSEALEAAEAATCAVAMPRGLSRRLRFRAEAIPFLRRARAGRLTAGGARHAPADDGSPLPRVEWLRGAAMAFRCEALPPERFSRDLFALAEVGAGMGEELALARIVRGRIVFVRGLAVLHPGETPSRTLSSQPQRQGFAIAYSRRLLSDLSRGGRPRLADRAALAWSWAGGLAAAGADWALRRRREQRLFAWGYLRGILQGALRPPRHARLTPSIDWEAEALASLAGAGRIGRAKEAACPVASA
jgi:GT2 family glycosyltransferase